MSPVQLPLLIGFVVTSLASLGIYATGSKDPEWRHHTHGHSIVPFIAATTCLAMTLGTGTSRRRMRLADRPGSGSRGDRGRQDCRRFSTRPRWTG